MEKIKEEALTFLVNKIGLSNLKKFLPLNDDSRYDLISFIENEIVIPLSNSYGEKEIDEELLKDAETTIDDLHREDLDINDLNEKLLKFLL